MTLELQSGLTPQDRIVLAALECQEDDKDALARLQAMSNPACGDYVPSLVSSMDLAPAKEATRHALVEAYLRWAQSVVRHPSDTVLVTHLILYSVTMIPSAWWLWHHYTPAHAFLHWAYTLYCAGPFTLLMHQHIHHNGILARRFAVIDKILPGALGFLAGHTFDSYRFHHKMHHTEENGPDDLSSTIYYQRDSIAHFLCYFLDFALCCWFKLPLYYWQRGRKLLATRVFLQEMASWALIAIACYLRPRSALVLFVVPLVQMRIGLMLGNFGQHALIDEEEPSHDLRSSITLIDANSNRQCFNDGYHTSHQCLSPPYICDVTSKTEYSLNPLRHWRDHPYAMLAAKDAYASGRALVFKDIDFLAISCRLFVKDYDHLARCLVPMGEQKQMTHEERCQMLRRKTRQFSAQEIAAKWSRRRSAAVPDRAQ